MGLLWNGSVLKIKWPIAEDKAVLSEKDRKQPRLVELVTLVARPPLRKNPRTPAPTGR